MNNNKLPSCPHCKSPYVYDDGSILICPECAYEFNQEDIKIGEVKIVDANGNILINGDSVVVIKDLKLKGSSTIVKIGTKVKNIRLVNNDHNIDCRIPGIGRIALKSKLVKKYRWFVCLLYL